MPVYFKNIIDPLWCVGNSLSTINYNFTALDINLSSLSSYTVNSVNYLSATIQSISANLQTEINFLSTSIQNIQTEINYLSANTAINYVKQGTLFQLSNGQINWNTTNIGINAKVTLSANGLLNNPSGLVAGQEGNLIVQLGSTSGLTLTAFGNQWAFHNYLSAMNLSANGRTKIHYYYDGSNLLSNLTFF